MTRKLVPIEDHPTLVRDVYSHAVLNTDATGLRRARERKETLLSEKAKQREIQETIARLSYEISTIQASQSAQQEVLNNLGESLTEIKTLLKFLRSNASTQHTG